MSDKNEKVQIKRCIVTLCIMVVCSFIMNIPVFAQENGNTYLYEEVISMISEKTKGTVEKEFQNILALAKSSTEEMGVSIEEVCKLSVAEPFIIYSLDETCQDEIYYYPIYNTYTEEVIFTVQVIGPKSDWGYEVSNEFSQILNEIGYVKSKYIFYKSNSTIVADDGYKIENLTENDINSKIYNFANKDINEKIKCIKERVRSFEEEAVAYHYGNEIARYRPSLLKTSSNVVACSLYKPQGQGKYGLCWAASAATIINYRKGTKYTAKNIADKIGIGYNDGGTVYNVSYALLEYGVNYKVALKQIGWNMINRNVDTKKPIYVHASSGSDHHAVVCFGYKVVDGTKYVYLWNPGTERASIVKYKSGGTKFSYNTQTWKWRYTVARNV